MLSTDYVTCSLKCQMTVWRYWLGSSDVPGFGQRSIRGFSWLILLSSSSPLPQDWCPHFRLQPPLRAVSSALLILAWVRVIWLFLNYVPGSSYDIVHFSSLQWFTFNAQRPLWRLKAEHYLSPEIIKISIFLDSMWILLFIKRRLISREVWQKWKAQITLLVTNFLLSHYWIFEFPKLSSIPLGCFVSYPFQEGRHK